MTNRTVRRLAAWSAVALLATAACSKTPTSTTTPPPSSFTLNPCSGPDTLDLAVNASALVDCTNGGTTLTLAGNGASYLIVAQMPTDAVANQTVRYQLASGTASAASALAGRQAQRAVTDAQQAALFARTSGSIPAPRRMTMQDAFTAELHANARQQFRSAAWQWPSGAAARINGPSFDYQPPPIGSTTTFTVRASFVTGQLQTVTAALAYAGNNVLLYVDQASPAPGFSQSQLTSFGQYFDQTLYDIDSTAFGQPSDVDGNNRVIMLLTPLVNSLVTASACQSQGYVAGYFNPEDLAGPSDPASNHGEIFYSEVPDPNGSVSCAHAVSDVEFDVPATFLHELQHLINYSTHVLLHGQDPQSSWLDEGMSIVAEELGSVHYEQMCPAPACRGDPSQIFPDSSQTFVAGFLYDSYVYAFLPDTASVTLHNDSEDGSAWRGGDWLLVRWLADQFGNNLLRQLEDGPSDGVTAIQAATGQSFPTLFGHFGLALYTDSLPGLPRATAPADLRFVSRNVSQLWARLFTTSASGAITTPRPLYLYPISSDTTTNYMEPGAMAFNRLDTPASSAAVTIRFSAPGGAPIASPFHPQLSVFRLPPGQ